MCAVRWRRLVVGRTGTSPAFRLLPIRPATALTYGLPLLVEVGFAPRSRFCFSTICATSAASFFAS